jgi:Sulfate permease family
VDNGGQLRPAQRCAVAVRILPRWLRGSERAWLGRDLVAGLIVGSVVVPQAAAYAQIAGLPPSAGLAAAPGALDAYALLGTSRSLVVSAPTAKSALSLAAVGPLADGDAAKFTALSVALARPRRGRPRSSRSDRADPRRDGGPPGRSARQARSRA